MIRYPGGKSKLLNKLQKIGLDTLFDDKEVLVSVCCGAAHLELQLAKQSKTLKEVHLYDVNVPLVCLWSVILYDGDWLCGYIHSYEPSVKDFYRFKKDLSNVSSLPAFREDERIIAAKKLILHQTSYSGLAEMGGVLGGPDQKSKYKIDCRWNPEKLIKKIKSLQELQNSTKIFVTHLDYTKSLKVNHHVGLDSTKKIIYFIDPPYFEKGEKLYKNSFTSIDHVKLKNILKEKSTMWILSYDDCDWVRTNYSWANIKELDVSYKIGQNTKKKKELVIFNE